ALPCKMLALRRLIRVLRLLRVALIVPLVLRMIGFNLVMVSRGIGHALRLHSATNLGRRLRRERSILIVHLAGGLGQRGRRRGKLRRAVLDHHIARPSPWATLAAKLLLR